ncbi:MAG: histidine-type phosphatase, partial [Muribaculaceae bacterium]|nr:histidine-type phosphatase [Muribaculaceae bacterium]
MKKLLFLLISVLAIVLAASAGTRDDFKANIKASANNLQAYPDSNLPQLTPAPSGYKPFYIDHYGRHGSRWL